MSDLAQKNETSKPAKKRKPGRPSRPRVSSLEGVRDDYQLSVTDVSLILNEHYATSYERIVGGMMGDFIRRGKLIRIEARVVRAYMESTRIAARQPENLGRRKAS